LPVLSGSSRLRPLAGGAWAMHATPKKMFWQGFKSYTWIFFQCWVVWYVAKVTFILIYAGVGAVFTREAAYVIDGIALIPAFAWYVWRYMPRGAGQLADGIEPGDRARTIRWGRGLLRLIQRGADQLADRAGSRDSAKTVRWGRGLLRLWVVLTVLWVGAAGFVAWQNPTSDQWPGTPMPNVFDQFDTASKVSAPPWEQLSPGDRRPDAKFDPDAFIASYTASQRQNLGRQIGWVFGPPILVLLLGFAGNWILRGFKM
jgi:hypothetical protein